MFPVSFQKKKEKEKVTHPTSVMLLFFKYGSTSQLVTMWLNPDMEDTTFLHIIKFIIKSSI